MNAKQIEAIILEATGNPSCGPIKDNAELIAQAIEQSLNPKAEATKGRETRLATKPEIPAAEQ